MDRKMRALLIVLLLIAFGLAALTVTTYLSASKQLKDNEIAEKSLLRRVFMSDDGYYGVEEYADGEQPVDNLERQILIEPCWNSLTLIDDGRYIAQTTDSDHIERFGIIDENGRTILPLIYTKMDAFRHEVIFAGNDDGSLSALSMSGELMFPERFRSYEYDDEIYWLYLGYDCYKARYVDGLLRIDELSLRRNVCGIPTDLTILVSSKLKGIDYSDYVSVTEKSLAYAQALLENSATKALIVSETAYIDSIMKDNVLLKQSVTSVNGVAVSITELDGVVSYSCMISLDFNNPEIVGSEYSAQLLVSLCHGNNGSYVVCGREFKDVTINYVAAETS